MLKSVIIE